MFILSFHLMIKLVSFYWKGDNQKWLLLIIKVNRVPKYYSKVQLISRRKHWYEIYIIYIFTVLSLPYSIFRIASISKQFLAIATRQDTILSTLYILLLQYWTMFWIKNRCLYNFRYKISYLLQILCLVFIYFQQTIHSHISEEYYLIKVRYTFAKNNKVRIYFILNQLKE